MKSVVTNIPQLNRIELELINQNTMKQFVRLNFAYHNQNHTSYVTIFGDIATKHFKPEEVFTEKMYHTNYIALIYGNPFMGSPHIILQSLNQPNQDPIVFDTATFYATSDLSDKLHCYDNEAIQTRFKPTSKQPQHVNTYTAFDHKQKERRKVRALFGLDE